MLNTFANAERQHLRRLERERHLNLIETITGSDSILHTPLEDDVSAAADVLSGVPLAQRPGEDPLAPEPEQHKDLFRWLRHNKLVLLGVSAILVVILLAFTLGVDVGEGEVELDKKRIIDDQKPTIDEKTKPPINANDLRRFNHLFSQILDWGVTQRDVLENVSSAQARALHWLAYEDSTVLKKFEVGLSPEIVRTRFALATVYFSTQGPTFVNDFYSQSSWKDNTLWLTGFPVCQWFGVDCLEDEFGKSSLGRVKSLNLSSNGLEGELPNELSLLQLDIRSLDFSENSIGGTVPEMLSDLKNLMHLYLGPNKFVSSIPEQLYDLSHLTHFYVNDCGLSGEVSTRIGELKQLHGLGLHDNNLAGSIPDQIGNMDSIQAIYLDGNRLSGQLPSTIGKLTGLVDLRLRQNSINGTLPTEMKNLVSLHILYLDDNQLTGKIEPLLAGSFHFMRDLQLHNNQFSGAIPSEIGSLLFLNNLYLDGNQFTHLPSQLGRLSSLESLYAFGNRLQGFIPTTIGLMQNLRQLRLQNNSLSGPLPAEISNLQKLEILLLENNTLGGPIPTTLVKLTSVKSIVLHQNRFTGVMPPALCSLSHISELTSDCAGDVPEVECACCTSCYFDS